jgi:hypothetical protein
MSKVYTKHNRVSTKTSSFGTSGSGITCLSAYKSKRYYIGYEIDKVYVKLAHKRLEPYLLQKELF